MRNFKNLALAALTLVATVAPTAITPAQAYTRNAGQEALVSAIRETGVTVTTSTCEDDGSYGYFSYYTNTWRNAKIQICTNVATTQAQVWETLRHEAVHVAQKCENIDHGNSFETLTTTSWLRKYGSQSDAQFIKSAYPKAKWAIEFEAFTLQKYSNQTIANIVNKACN